MMKNLKTRLQAKWAQIYTWWFEYDNEKCWWVNSSESNAFILECLMKEQWFIVGNEHTSTPWWCACTTIASVGARRCDYILTSHRIFLRIVKSSYFAKVLSHTRISRFALDHQHLSGRTSSGNVTCHKPSGVLPIFNTHYQISAATKNPIVDGLFPSPSWSVGGKFPVTTTISASIASFV